MDRNHHHFDVSSETSAYTLRLLEQTDHFPLDQHSIPEYQLEDRRRGLFTLFANTGWDLAEGNTRILSQGFTMS